MLVEFSVKNYGSIKERQTLNLATSKSNQFGVQSNIDASPYLLPVVAIFGANASGKSTLTRAMDTFRSMILFSARLDEDDKLPVTAFSLNKKTALEPSEFEAVFVSKGVLYRYGFSATVAKVYSESMSMIPPGGRTNELFRRVYKEDLNEYEWYINDKLVKGPKNAWRASTKANALFLSIAVKLNAEIFKEPYNWIKQHFQILHEDQSILASYTAEAFTAKAEISKDRVLEFIKQADVSVDEIRVEERQIPDEVLNNIPEAAREEFKRDFKYAVSFAHTADDGSKVYWDLSEESGGVEKLFTLAGPIINVLNEGKVFVIDELHNRLHPLLLGYIVRLFQSKEENKNNAQLILTSHDLTIMNAELLGRDQIWFTEKGQDKSTRLFSLSSLKSRETIFWRSYIMGKYGAIPNIKGPDFIQPNLFDL